MTQQELGKVLQQSPADEVIIAHFGALQYPNMKSQHAILTALEGFHPNIVLAYDEKIIQG